MSTSILTLGSVCVRASPIKPAVYPTRIRGARDPRVHVFDDPAFLSGDIATGENRDRLAGDLLRCISSVRK